MLRLALVTLTLFSFFAPPAWAQVELRFKYDQPGEAVVETVTSLQQTLTLAGMDLDTAVESTERKRLSFGRRDGEGNTLLNVKTQRIQTNMSLPGGMSFEFDSDAPPRESDNPALEPLDTLMRASAKADITFAIDDKGKVQSVAGLEKLVEAIPPEMKALVGEQFSKKTVIRNLQQELDRLPEGPVTPGDFWDRTYIFDAGSGQLLTFKRRFEYAGTAQVDGKTYDKLTITDTGIDFTIAEDSPLPLSVKKSDLKVEASEGEILFDRAAGRDVKSTYKTQLVGSITFLANGQELPAELDLVIATSTRDVK